MIPNFEPYLSGAPKGHGVEPPGLVRDFTSCIYARAARLRMSPLDFLIMSIAFVLMGLETARDATEHSQASFLRKRTLPLRWPDRRMCRCGALARVAALSILKVMDVGFSIAVPANSMACRLA